LPRDCLLLRTLRLLLLLVLLGTLSRLLLWPLLLSPLDPLLRLLSRLSVPLLPLVLLLLPACLRLLRLSLRMLLCLRRRALLLPPLLPFKLAFFVLLVVLRVRRDKHPEKQTQGSGAGSANELHSDGSSVNVAISACMQTTSPP
jgi:hypothetical protein